MEDSYRNDPKAILSNIAIECNRAYTFIKVKDQLSKDVNPDNLFKIKTKKGETQIAEKNSIEYVRGALDKLGYSYKEAGSQQSKDFQNINDTGLNIEVKKTDSLNIYFNDTLPTSDIYYIIMFTGNNKYRPQIIYINGCNLTKRDIDNLSEYKMIIEDLKNEWARKTYSINNKANKLKYFSVYPRPTYKMNILHLID